MQMEIKRKLEYQFSYKTKQTLFIYLFLISLLEYNCLTMVCQFLLYNKVNQLYIYIHPHLSSLLHLPPSHPPYPTPQVVTKHQADLSVLCGCFPLAVCFTLGSVYMSMDGTLMLQKLFSVRHCAYNLNNPFLTDVVNQKSHFFIYYFFPIRN